MSSRGLPSRIRTPGVRLPEGCRELGRRAWRAHRDDPIERLTPRQREVLALMAEGRSNQAIAKELTLTEKAIVKHVSHVYDELGLPACPDDHRRVLAVVRYLTSESAVALRGAP